MFTLQAISITAFILVHIFAGKLRFLDSTPRSQWLSAAGGISIAYVFLHIFPELAEAQESITSGSSVLPFIEHHAYFVALAGLAIFYGLEKMIKSRPAPENNQESSGVFWLHVSSFAIYNALIGYLLVHREEQDLSGLLFYSSAMTLHFLVNDYGLRKHHKDAYARIARWVLSAAIVTGWLVGLATRIQGPALGALFAFLAGGIVLNVLKEELPEERQSRFTPFALGLAAYSALLIFL